MAEDWLYSGVDFTIAGNGGPDCVSFLSLTQRMMETFIYTCVCLTLTYSSLRYMEPVLPSPVLYSQGRSCFLTLYGLVFGVEIGFKLASNQVIWLLNPCHVISMVQLCLLSLPVTPFTAAVYRVHLYWITGPLLALLFPVTDSLLFNGEVKIYWIQHILLLLAPVPLLHQGVEKTSDWTWPALAYSLYSLFHWLILQPISKYYPKSILPLHSLSLGLITEANLNNMLCPPSSMPGFLAGAQYRNLAMLHQLLLVPLVGKCYPILVSWIVSKLQQNTGYSLNNNKQQ